MPVSIIIIFFLFIIIGLYCYWRFFYFFRDPIRHIPAGNNIVSSADGTVVYVRKVENSIVPIAIKNKKEIKLEEITKCDLQQFKNKSYFIIGVFMHPTSVHVNRAPISGLVKKIIYTKAKNSPMTFMWWRVIFRLKPYEKYSNHIFENERNTILIEGDIPVFVTQIGDIYVNKIDCWVKENEKIEKGQKIGRIIMGSQVDIVFPCDSHIRILTKEGDKIKAGETILAEIT